jgi:hypothetical protein
MEYNIEELIVMTRYFSLLGTGLNNRTVIYKSYYSVYRAAMSAVYVQMQLDVTRLMSLVHKKDLDVIDYVEEIDGYKDGLDVNMRLFDMSYEMDLDIPISIERMRDAAGEEAAT